jgi:dTMP kinase
MFICFEGIDGSGKSTQAKLLAEYLQQRSKVVFLTAEPTKHAIGKLIREAFNKKNTLEEPTIALLFAADRLEHILNPSDGILQQLKKKSFVICDRYYFSSYAYHSVHVPMAWVIENNKLAAQLCKPTATIFIDVNAETAWQRIKQNRHSTELYETLENLEKVYNNYLQSFEILKKEENIIVINGNQSVEAVHAEVVNAINNLNTMS